MAKEPYLGELEQMVLWSVLRHDGDAYGTVILDELNERVDRRVTPGALYATLDRLEEKEVIRSTLADPEPGRGGRRRRYVAVTELGRHALERVRLEWMRLWEGLEGAVGGK